MTVTYTGGVDLKIFLPSGVRTIASGDVLDDLTTDDVEALSLRSDFDTPAKTGKASKANKETAAAATEGTD